MSDTPSNPSPVVRLSEAGDWNTQQHGDVYHARFTSITRPLGGRHLGARLVEIPPGKRAWPHHCHHNNDELFVILAGAGQARVGDRAWPIAAGDVVVAPASGPDGAHQLINTSADAPLRYLAVSSMNAPDVMEYPDTGKVGVFAGAPPGGDKQARTFAAFLDASAQVGYWDGE